MPPLFSRWDESHMPSQLGRLVIVTGANTGLGFATALRLARAGAHVILACRNETRGLEAQKKIHDQLRTDNEDKTAGDAEYMQLDMGELQTVREFASAFTAKFSTRRLDILVLNAGVKAVEYGETVDGFKQQFGVNHLGHFALTALLLPMMKLEVSDLPPARVVSISSISHQGSSLDMKQLSVKPENYDAITRIEPPSWRIYSSLTSSTDDWRRLEFLPRRCCLWFAIRV